MSCGRRRQSIWHRCDPPSKTRSAGERKDWNTCSRSLRSSHPNAKATNECRARWSVCIDQSTSTSRQVRSPPGHTSRPVASRTGSVYIRVCRFGPTYVGCDCNARRPRSSRARRRLMQRILRAFPTARISAVHSVAISASRRRCLRAWATDSQFVQARRRVAGAHYLPMNAKGMRMYRKLIRYASYPLVAGGAAVAITAAAGQSQAYWPTFPLIAAVGLLTPWMACMQKMQEHFSASSCITGTASRPMSPRGSPIKGSP